jgi:hypothetical protein
MWIAIRSPCYDTCKTNLGIWNIENVHRYFEVSKSFEITFCIYILCWYLLVQVGRKNMIVCGLHKNDRMFKITLQWLNYTLKKIHFLFFCLEPNMIASLKIYTSSYQSSASSCFSNSIFAFFTIYYILKAQYGGLK